MIVKERIVYALHKGMQNLMTEFYAEILLKS